MAFSDVTAQKLAVLQIYNKYKNFCLTNIPPGFHTIEFGNFIKVSNINFCCQFITLFYRKMGHQNHNFDFY